MSGYERSTLNVGQATRCFFRDTGQREPIILSKAPLLLRLVHSASSVCFFCFFFFFYSARIKCVNGHCLVPCNFIHSNNMINGPSEHEHDGDECVEQVTGSFLLAPKSTRQLNEALFSISTTLLAPSNHYLSHFYMLLQ